jgi:antitoxin component YwqK of YwqJK toxin-antitoxin module
MKTLFTIICLFVGIKMQAQNIVQYTFDKQGRLITEHFESVYKVNFAFDPEGNIISKAVTNYSSLEILQGEREGKSLVIYPNPAKEFFVVECHQTGIDGEIYVFDISGKAIAKTLLKNGRAVIDVSSYKSGMFFIEIKTSNKIQIKKLMIE